jgi:hypothetical protein
LRFSTVRHPRTNSGYMIINRMARAKREPRTRHVPVGLRAPNSGGIPIAVPGL